MQKEINNGNWKATLLPSSHAIDCNRYSIKRVNSDCEIVVWLAGVKFTANVGGAFFVNGSEYQPLLELIGKCQHELKSYNDKLVSDAFKD